MIVSFKGGNEAHLIFSGTTTRRFRHLHDLIVRKLTYLNDATRLNDLARIPGHRLEKLMGDRKGQHAIRINDQWRLCFRWDEQGPSDVELTDYH